MSHSNATRWNHFPSLGAPLAQAAVLRALAESDFDGNQRIPIPRLPVRDPLPGEPWGLYPWDKPPIIFGSGGFRSERSPERYGAVLKK